MYRQSLLVFLIGISANFVFANAQVLPKDSALPYHVAILQIGPKGPATFKCFGAIVRRRYVLTAAQCVKNLKSSELVVRCGGELGPVRPERPHEDPRTFHGVVKTYIPRFYSEQPCRKHQHDIAILKVRESFDLVNDTRYKKVSLPEFDNDYDENTATIAGYYPSNNPGQEYVYLLKPLPMTVLSNEDCQAQSNIVVTEGSMCAKLDRIEKCFVEIGSPLIRDGTIIGIMSERRSTAGKPDIYTRVTSYLYFINNVLQHRRSADILIQ